MEPGGENGGQKMNSALLSSKSMIWGTPPELFERLDAEYHFVLDPAATKETAKCRLYYTPDDDGLRQNWNCGGAVFCNPPYGRQLGMWVKKAYEESQKMAWPVVLLIPARTDTSYFHEYILGKASIRFLRGRIRFLREDGSRGDAAPFPSMVVVYNSARKTFEW